MNIQIISGNIGQDAEVRTTKGGDTVTTFSVAVNEYMGKDKEPRVTWFRVEMWNREGIADYLTKGTRVTVQGRARCNAVEDEDSGKTIYYWSIDATRGEVVFGGGGSGGQDEEEEQPRRGAKAKGKSASKGRRKPADDEDDDDLPF